MNSKKWDEEKKKRGVLILISCSCTWLFFRRMWRTNPLWLQPYGPSAAQLFTLIHHICFPMKAPLPHTHTHTYLHTNWTNARPCGKSSSSHPGLQITTSSQIACSCIYQTKICNVIAVQTVHRCEGLFGGLQFGSAVFRLQQITQTDCRSFQVSFTEKVWLGSNCGHHVWRPQSCKWSRDIRTISVSSLFVLLLKFQHISLLNISVMLNKC